MESENKINNDIPGDNIFKELSGGLDFGRQEEEIAAPKKDKIYYLNLYSNIFSITNIVLFVIFALLYAFVSVQNNPENYSKSFLDPFCFVILSDEMENTGDYCSSVASLVVDYDTKTTALKSDLAQKVSGIIQDLYVYESFIDSKEIAFLLDKNSNRLKALDMINDFDKLKLDFSGMDKNKIQCSGMKITGDGTLDVNCIVYSSSWEESKAGNGIIGTSGDIKSSQLQGSSVSVAASFLNYIEKNPQYNFQIVDKQKDFTSNLIIGEGPYVKSTTLNLKLKYNNLKNTLSL